MFYRLETIKSLWLSLLHFAQYLWDNKTSWINICCLSILCQVPRIEWQIKKSSFPLLRGLYSSETVISAETKRKQNNMVEYSEWVWMAREDISKKLTPERWESFNHIDLRLENSRWRKQEVWHGEQMSAEAKRTKEAECVQEEGAGAGNQCGWTLWGRENSAGNKVRRMSRLCKTTVRSWIL